MGTMDKLIAGNTIETRAFGGARIKTYKLIRFIPEGELYAGFWECGEGGVDEVTDIWAVDELDEAMSLV